MREFLKQALSEAFEKLDNQTPKTKKDVAYIDINDIKPTDIAKFIADKDIPEHAYFNVDCYDHVCICYNYDVPTTEKERLEYKRRVFPDRVFPKLYKLLTANGYKRIGFNSASFKDYKVFNVYDSYINGDIGVLEKYYSLFFKKNDVV